MSCEQRMDDMQRFVDEDLTYAEQENLMAHIKQCPDCAASFEQLQRLSAELSLLPMVTPPFSIVDSILPKLAELDAQQAAIQVPYLPEVKTRKKTKLPWKISGGLVAAAVLFGLILNMQPSSSKLDAGQMLQTGSASKEAASAADSVVGTQEKRTLEAPAAATSAPEKSENLDRVTSNTDQLHNDQSNELKSDNTHSKVIDQDKPIDRLLTSQTEKKQEINKQSSPSPALTTDESKYTVNSGAVIPTATPAAATTPAPSAIPTPIPSAAPAPPALAAPTNPILASDDGNLIGLVERQIVQVQTPDGNRIYTSSVQWNASDTITLVKWQNNQQLTYEVKAEDGQVKRFIVDPILKTEQEQKSD